ncbi:hypothetical protein KP509_17G066600 [Ceratopteris richardii]|uniref:J domain-containing protein n=1 Tax=Ceratopteris richardii TaxID=49495 RepID=A0A8T2SVT5_CERRI|nr:hypothetical protein KP509_17G066600 [Ceratopteris richardii]
MTTPLTIRTFRTGKETMISGGIRRSVNFNHRNNRFCTNAYLGSSSPPSRESYLALGVDSDASANDVKKAYRRLALKFHPDVCKDDYCTNKFLQINDAYETVMNFLGANNNVESLYPAETSAPEPMMGAFDDSWEDWEEWMGWEGAGIRDYTSHINYDL